MDTSGLGFLLRLGFNVPMYFSGVGFDVMYNGSNYIASPMFQGMEEFTRQSDMNVTELQLSFSLADQTLTAIVLGQEYYNKSAIIDRIFLDENNQVIHGERVWKGKVTSYSDDDEEGLNKPYNLWVLG